MRILLTIAELALGGAERVTVELARLARDAGNEVAVVAAPGPLDRELAELGVPVLHLPAGGRSPLAVARRARAVAGAVRGFTPDLVHAHNVRATFTAALGMRLASPLAPPPLVATFHGVAGEDVAGAARLLRPAAAVACVSGDLAEQLAGAGFPRAKLAVVENAVQQAPLTPERRASLDAELGLEGMEVVATVGRLVPQKAHDRFVDAAAIVARRRPEARFLVVGDGPLRTELERRARELDLGSRLAFTGLRDDAPALIARSDLLVFSSNWEGLSIAALEALAAGVPVVSTDVGGMRDLLSRGAGEIVVEATPAALAGAIEALLEAPQRRADMGRAGRAMVAERFSPEAMARGYDGLYERVTGARPFGTSAEG
jgi:glycosyltransferase involved in cell wall biosynthesis